MNIHDYSPLFYLNPFPSWVYDLKTSKILEVNQAAIDLYGYSKDEFLTLTVKDLTSNEAIPKLMAIQKGLPLQTELRNFGTFTHQKKNGAILHMEITGYDMEIQGRNCFLMVCQDITDSKNEQFQKDFLNKISTVFNDGIDLNMALVRLCELTARFGDFSFCEIWLPDIHQKALKLSAHIEMDTAAKKFYVHTESKEEVGYGMGLPGEVWKSKESIIWKDIDLNEFFIRNIAAKSAGLKCALGMPLRHQEKIVGVMVAGTKENTAKMEECQAILANVESHIASEISNKRLESDLNHLFDSLPGIICIADLNGRFLKINRAGCELLGYEEHEIVGYSFDKFTHPLDRVVFTNEIKKITKGNTILNFENRYVTKKNNSIWLNWHCNFIIEEGVMYAMAKNITEKKKLRELVVDTSQLSKIGDWEIDLVTNTIYWSKLVYQIHEVDPDNFIPTHSSSVGFYREDFKEKVTTIFKQAIATREPFDFEAPIITAKGNQLWIRAIGSTEFVDDTCMRIFGSFQDINSRKETESRLKSITDDLPGVTFQYFIFPDGTKKLTSVSEASMKIWGLSPEDCERDSEHVWSQIKKGGDFKMVAAVIQQSLETLSQWHMKWRNILPNGELRWHEGYGTSYCLPDGTYLFNSMVFDITEKVNASQLYEEASELAKIGSWELDLVSQDESNTMYWSSMVKKIMGVDEGYNPSFTGGREFYTPESKDIIERVGEALIKEGIEFDEELQITTKKGKEKWIRIIGKSERNLGVCTKIFGSIQDIHIMKTTELQLKEILESISDAFYAVDAHWNFTYFNKEAENLLHRKSSEVLGKNIWEEFAYVKNTELERVYRKVTKTRTPISFEYFATQDGSWYEINAYPSSDGVSSYFKKINERKKIAEELQKAYDEKTQILESIGDAFFAVDKDWIVTYWNREAEDVLGRKRDVILGKNLWKEYAEVIDSDFYRQYHKAMETGRRVTFEDYNPMLAKWFEVTAYPSSEGLSVYFKDITLKKETDIRILQANERFEKVARAATDAIWDWDIENDRFHCGEGFDKLFGYNVKKTVKGDAFWRYGFHPKDIPKIQASLFECLQDPSKEYWRQEYRIIHKNGEEKTVIDKGIVIRNETGKAIRMVGAITDISHRVVYEKEVLELNKMLKKHVKELEISNIELEQFAFIASHDLQEPLRMISSFLNQLQRKYADQLDDKAHQYIHFATDGAKRMKQIILDLLDYSKAGQLSDHLELINLNELIEDYGVLRRRLIQEKEAAIVVNHLPNVTCFRAPLVQTLHCLFDNAIKYSKENTAPIIKIAVSETETDWLISIEDNGIGIDPHLFDKIFIIFQRLHNRNTYEGAGIGLSIAKKHVELWGGQIWVESELDKGSTFYFTIDKHIDI